MTPPVICFGQQPCGFFPRRFLWAKIRTARRLQAEIGGEIVFFYHDSDHDPRETQTILRHRKTGQAALLNFAFENRIQRRWSPLFLKRVPAAWKAVMARQISAYVGPRCAEAFRLTEAGTVADFCLEMYRRLGLLDGIRIARSSDPAFRRAAGPVSDYFVDAPFAGEIVRARPRGGALALHEGGEAYVAIPDGAETRPPFAPERLSPTRDSRLGWMQSVLRCTHYVAGAGEQAYLRREDAPEIAYVNRETIDRSDEAFTEFPD